ncbi:hypothetical protein Sjap_014696 [Stephania japonica]|uniref:Uncharacterized protein n=1 Tax=Stephania japonica TaxID=461633 RepID=A0AAP0NRQ7_9MAGN
MSAAKELASYKELNSVPDRYVRPELEFDVVCLDDSLKIPIIDFSKLNDDQQFANDELMNFRNACEEWGFFQLINHGVSEDLIEKMKDDIKEFFKLPLEKKNAYAQLPNSIEGYGQLFVVSEDQKLDWADMLLCRTLPLDQRNMRYWPAHPPSFRETLDQYSTGMQRVSLVLFGLLAKNLGLEPEKVTDHFKNGAQAMRINYYPPAPQADKEKWMWVPVEPIPGALTVNIGDIIEVMSNGAYKSIEHRVVINLKECLSIAAFHSLTPDGIISPIPDLLKENDPNYITMSFKELNKRFLAQKLDGKSFLEYMKIKK